MKNCATILENKILLNIWFNRLMAYQLLMCYLIPVIRFISKCWTVTEEKKRREERKVGFGLFI